MSDQVETRTVTPDEDGMRLDRWFKLHRPDVAFGLLQKLLRSGQVRVDGARARTNDRLTAGAAVRVPPVARREPVAPALRKSRADDKAVRALSDMVLFEDRDLVVLNKPHGLAVQGGSGTDRHVDGMLEAMAKPDGDRPRLVHRLDRDTSGVLVVAKSRKIAADLGEVFRGRTAKKIYWSLVEGVPQPKQGRISLFLSKTLTHEGEKVVVRQHGDEDAVHSITYYSLVERSANRIAWLSLKPVTGRTHQLRAHTAHIGHPILGDPKYGSTRKGDAAFVLPDGIANKLHLHARRITLPHPRGGTIDVTAPLPPHMAASFALLGFDASAYDPIVEAPEE